MTNLKSRLTKLAAAVAEQAARDPSFAAKLEEIIGGIAGKSSARAKTAGVRKGGRRAAAALDPVAIAQKGPDVLRHALSRLDVGQLLDIVAEYGMDPGKLVMKWKDRDRIVDRIIEASMTRATKGDAFRSDPTS